MSEWLPFVGFADRVVFNRNVYDLGTTAWYPVDILWRSEEDFRRISEFPVVCPFARFWRATNVSASVSKVDDFSYRFTVRFRIGKGFSVSFYEDFSIYLAKRCTEPNFRTDYDDHLKENKEYLEADFYLFGYRGLYDKIMVKQVDGVVSNLFDVEFSGVQVMQECVLRKEKIQLSAIGSEI